MTVGAKHPDARLRGMSAFVLISSALSPGADIAATSADFRL